MVIASFAFEGENTKEPWTISRKRKLTTHYVCVRNRKSVGHNFVFYIRLLSLLSELDVDISVPSTTYHTSTHIQSQA